ncbi:uncharacterized protein B0I36DRAFT_366996 [Microdochium trichocladiopsis]|uniref:Ig-like domain-containing protein n=1 Tax=Microdochium trichocladiopsis TaxID=1682393 RepID=A0A9P8Y1H8_9PEZI|nr:uncharacterized protein B0I36DRAFT_366996 [Microdochium trichocladiopsis]KAH7025101.1 hypothetical protein B0I36DRAFT_366996 [Microdochium trichocladiopsis]
MSIKTIILTTAFAALSGLAQAGPGAIIYACINLPTPPSQNFTVNFKAGAGTDRCLNNNGTDASVVVSRQGITCASVGYVEAKTSSWGDWCASASRFWSLSWETEDQTRSGSTNTEWFRRKDIELVGYTPGTYICGRPASCTQRTITWDNQGPLYIIFNPLDFTLKARDSSAAAMNHPAEVMEVKETESQVIARSPSRIYGNVAERYARAFDV